MTKFNLPADLRVEFLEERREDEKAAKAFERLCKENKPEILYECAKWLDERVDAWRLAFLKVAKLRRVSHDIQTVFVNIWIERKHLPLMIGNRRVVSNGLRVLMPGNHSGPPITVFRGAGAHERRRRIYGFSWSTDLAVARKFAEHGAKLPPGGVVLKTLARPEAILLIRQPENYYDEDEVVIDPFRIDTIEVVEYLSAPHQGP